MKTVLLIVFAIMVTISSNSQNLRKLTQDERRVIIDKGTEMPFSGKYDKHYERGTYHCKQCDAPLYFSSSKFSSGCGWPSFDDEIKGAVKRIPDPDGRRTEIICSNCGGHLGHVFIGEGFTSKDTRHCVNSISLDFQESRYAIFAGGCFWGVEHHFEKLKGVISAESGYIGGWLKNPTYYDVSGKKSGHAEAVRVEYNPRIVSYEELAKLFFEIHDPTQMNRQGPDIGEQYRSEIFYNDDTEREIAVKLINRLKEKGYNVVTKLTKATQFYLAEDFHQDYYSKKGTKPYCHIYTKRF